MAKLREQIIYEGADNVAAIVMETITGSNGVIIPPEGYLPGVRKICDDWIMMICDEVMAGWGRSGKMFSFENFDVKPDIVTFAKGITCGYVPLGGVVVSKEIASILWPQADVRFNLQQEIHLPVRRCCLCRIL